MLEFEAMDELGLEKTKAPETWSKQMTKLEQILGCLGSKHVFILHCRIQWPDSADCSVNAKELLSTVIAPHRNQGVCYILAG